MSIDKQHLKLLSDAAENRRSVFFSSEGVDIVFQTHIIEVASNHVVLANKVTPEYIRKVREGKRFFLHCQMVRFVTEQIDTDGVHILFPLMSLKVIEETRQSQRFPFDPEERVICEFFNPYDSETRLEKTVMDMSATGISLQTHHSQLFQPGTKFPEMRVLIDGEPYTKAAGTVIYLRRLMDQHGKLRVQVGFKFD